MNIGVSDGKFVDFNASMVTRHALITGATGTGKTITVKLLAEEFSKMGVPVFITDIKGDLSGFIKEGELSDSLKERLEKIGAPTPDFSKYSVHFWDLLKENGIPLRTTLSEMGPLLLSRLLNLNETQTGVLYAIFKMADEEGMLLLDFKDLSEMLKFVYENNKELSGVYGNLSKQSIGAIQRNLLILEQQGAKEFFQEPALDIRDFLHKDANGRGMINVLDARQIHHSPDLYSAYMLWLLSELFEELDEVGDQILPRLVFFFEESHLIFQNASKLLLEKIEQLVKLIRSKGVGVFFITQNPRDIPDNVLAQLGSKIQHALRAFTPAEQKVIRSVAKSFRNETDMDIAEEIMGLKTGQALISVIQEDGSPSPVEKAYIFAPESSMSKADDSLIESEIKNSFLYSKYEKTFDSVSAYEILQERAKNRVENVKEVPKEEKKEEEKDSVLGSLLKGSGRGDTPVQRMVKSAMGSIGTQVGRSLIRGIFGSFKR